MERMIVLRKIRNGRVKYGGIWFYPRQDNKKYDGRLDGLTMAFGIYSDPIGTRDNGFISLWGYSDMYYKGMDYWPGSNCIDNNFYWDWWYVENHKYLRAWSD